MKRKLAMIFATLLLAAMATSAFAQCPEEYTVLVGTSQCIHVCAGQVVNVNLVGRHFWSIDAFSLCTGCFCLTYASEDNSPQGIPTVRMVAGCTNSQSCSEECTAVAPPVDLVLGADPFYPLDYYGESDCLFMYMRFDHYLPVTMTNFAAFPGDGQVTLNWTTESESSIDHFEIVRDGVTATEVPALNRGATGSNYSWTDHLVTNGQTYSYSLVAVGMNGERDVCGVDGNPVTLSATPNAVQVPTAYALYQNYPNPFNPETSIAFDLVQGGTVDLAIYNVLGEKVSTLVSGNMSSGHHSVVFDGSKLSTGVYLYKLTVNGFSDTKKLVLLK
jgi:hypothetical protein